MTTQWRHRLDSKIIAWKWQNVVNHQASNAVNMQRCNMSQSLLLTTLLLLRRWRFNPSWWTLNIQGLTTKLEDILFCSEHSLSTFTTLSTPQRLPVRFSRILEISAQKIKIIIEISYAWKCHQNVSNSSIYLIFAQEPLSKKIFKGKEFISEYPTQVISCNKHVNEFLLR